MSKAYPITHDRTTAIRIALGQILNAQQTSEAVRLWQDKYASQPTFSVQYFARECCALFGIESERSQMVKSLVHELYVQKLNAAKEEPASAGVTGPHAEAAMEVFQLLFNALVDGIDPLRGRDILRFVESGLHKLPLAKDGINALQRWLNQNKANIGMNLPLPVLTMLINRTYVGLCEYCGPIKADQILHDAVTKVAKTGPGKKFHPQQLL